MALQVRSLRRMNSVIEKVARELCLELLDVYELDRAAGFYEAKHANFHVPPAASVMAALALMLQLRLEPPPLGTVCTERRTPKSHARSSQGKAPRR
jgi:hypothetical protein